MANPIIPRTPSGWNQWIYAKNIAQGVHLLDAPFPVLYTPATGFWMKSIVDTCAVSWINVFDPLSTFLLGGGASGTLTGSLGGLSVVEPLIDIFAAHGSFGLFQSAGRGPQMGYCVGD